MVGHGKAWSGMVWQGSYRRGMSGSGKARLNFMNRKRHEPLLDKSLR